MTNKLSAHKIDGNSWIGGCPIHGKGFPKQKVNLKEVARLMKEITEEESWKDRFDVATDALGMALKDKYLPVDKLLSIFSNEITQFIRQELDRVRTEERERYIEMINFYKKDMQEKPLDEFVNELQLQVDSTLEDYLSYKEGYMMGMIEAKNVVAYGKLSDLKGDAE